MTSEQTKSDRIWELVKNIDLKLYAIDGQTIERVTTRVVLTDDMVHLKIKRAPAAFPAIEEAVANLRIDGKKLEVSMQKDFIVIATAE